MKSSGTDIDGLVTVRDRMTSLKTMAYRCLRVLWGIDSEVTDKISKDNLNDMLDRFKARKSIYDAIVISDYFKGVVTEELLSVLSEIAGDIPVLVDPKVNNFKHYKNVFLITPNASEACFHAQVPFEEEKESVLQAGREILARLNCRYLHITNLPV